MTNNALGFQHVWVQGTDNDGVTLLLLHGTGGTEHDLVELGQSLRPHAHLLSPKGPVSENGMARFFKRLAEGVFDLEDLRQRTQDLAQFVVAASQTYHFDVTKVIAVGFSNGANIAASLLLSGTKVLTGAALMHPTVPFEPEPLPLLHGVSVLVTAGRSDPMVTTEKTQRLEHLLTTAQASLELAWMPGGHSLTRVELERVHSWINAKERPWN